MSAIPATTRKRIAASLPRFKKILGQAKERDINESDTVTIVTDMLEQVFGFDKYSEITREKAIQGNYCDIAIVEGKKVEYLIEVKAIGISLKDNHIKQAVNYAAREGVKWVVLTNGLIWQIHRVNTAGNKIESNSLIGFDIANMNHRNAKDQETLFLLCKRGIKKDIIDDFYQHSKSVNRHTIGAILLSDQVLNSVRKELKKITPGIKVDIDQIKSITENEILKRDILDSDIGQSTCKNIARLLKQHKTRNEKKPPKASTPSEVLE